MDLPRISTSRLQRVAADAEYPDAAASFDALCDACAATAWAKNLKLDADTIGRLIVVHGIVTKVEIPPEAGSVTNVSETVAEEPAAPTPTTTVAPPPVSDSSKSAGRGKKFCPSCKEIIGARSAACKHCGHKIKKPNDSKLKAVELDDLPEETVVETVLKSGVKHRPIGLGVNPVHTPSGGCPYQLQGTSLSEVRDWAEKVRDSGFPSDGEGTLYTYNALRYWARSFYDIFGDDFKVVVGHLKTLYQ